MLGMLRSLVRRAAARARVAIDLPHLRAFPDATREDEAAFERHAVALTSHYGVLGSGFMIVAILVWWPIDRLVQPDARQLEGFARLREAGMIVELATLGAFLLSRRVRSASLVTGPIACAAFLGCTGYFLGRMSGDLVWLADAMIGILPLALVPMRFARRVVTSLLVGLALPAGFFFPFPDNWRAPAARGQWSFSLFSIAGSLLLGEMLLRVLRRSFFQQRALDRARAGLSDLTRSLAERIGAQTGELQRLAGRLGEAQEAERRRISRDLHDQLGQELTAMRYTLSRLEEGHRSQPRAVPDLIADLDVLLDGATSTVRSFLLGLRPRVLDDRGLVAAAEWLCEHVRASGEIDCRLAVAGAVPDIDTGLDPDVALVVFRVLQEATTNARKHARATSILISLSAEKGRIDAAVSDDGAGFDPKVASDRLGLAGLRERVLASGGRLLLESAPGRGTRLSAAVPVRFVRRFGAVEAEQGGA